MIEPPILVHEMDDDTVDVYPSVEAAEASMESVDVEAGLYVAYDSHGRKLRIVPDGYVGRLYHSDDGISYAHELRPRLLERLELVGSDVHHLQEAPLGVLLNTLLAGKPKRKTLSDVLRDWSPRRGK